MGLRDGEHVALDGRGNKAVNDRNRITRAKAGTPLSHLILLPRASVEAGNRVLQQPSCCMRHRAWREMPSILPPTAPEIIVIDKSKDAGGHLIGCVSFIHLIWSAAPKANVVIRTETANHESDWPPQ